MKTKMMFGLLAVLVAAAAVSTVALPALASTAGLGNSTDPSISDAISVQDQVPSETQTRQRLRLCDQTSVCAEDCTQTQSRIRAMDGSCGDTYFGEGSQYRYGYQQQAGGIVGQANSGTSTQSHVRARDQSCLVTPTG
jgi:hypothetical protein